MTEERTRRKATAEERDAAGFLRAVADCVRQCIPEGTRQRGPNDSERVAAERAAAARVAAALAPLLLPKLPESALRQRALSAALRGKPVAPTEAELLHASVLAHAIVDGSPSGKPRGRGGRSKTTLQQEAAIQQAMRKRVPNR